jgi:uncharacterized protein YrzB (UPF0473 family)
MFFEAKDALDSNLLQSAFGNEVVLYDEDNERNSFKVLREFRLGEITYAVLCSSKQSKHEEYELFRVFINELSEVDLEIIDDDEEWEAVAEVYDELTVSM